MVERHLAKVDVAGSTPVSRSITKARKDAGSARFGDCGSDWLETSRVHERVHESYGTSLRLKQKGNEPPGQRCLSATSAFERRSQSQLLTREN